LADFQSAITAEIRGQWNGLQRPVAQHQFLETDLRFGSLTDIAAALSNSEIGLFQAFRDVGKRPDTRSSLRLDQIAARGLDGGLDAVRRSQFHARIVEVEIDRPSG